MPMHRAAFFVASGLLMLCLLLLSPAQAAWCHPLDNTARILASPNPNDVHPNWRGENYIGLGWSVAPGRRIVVDGISYISGSLYSSRGGLVEKHIYILQKEWSCD
jgi:hypothetical protein